MNPEKELNKICEENNGDLIIENIKVGGDGGSFIFITKYHLTFIYSDCFIKIIYDYGNSDTAEFNIKFPPSGNISMFELTTIEHLRKLFLFKKKRWTLTCTNPVLKNGIKKLLNKQKIKTLFKETSFEPTIKGIMKEKHYSIKTVFSLTYDNQVASIAPILEFHKELIDITKKN